MKLRNQIASKLGTFSGERLHPGVMIYPFAILAFFSGHRDPTVSFLGNAILGLASATAVFLAAMMLVVEKPIERHTFRFLLVFAVLIPIYGLWVFDEDQELRIIGTRIAQILTVLSTVYVAFCIGRSARGEKALMIFAFICTILLLGRAIYTILFRNSGGFDSYNTNTVGLWFAVMALIPLFLNWTKTIKWVIILLAILALGLTNSRTAIGAIFAGGVIYSSWGLLSRKRILFWLPILATFLFAYLIIYFLSGPRNSLTDLNLFFREWTGKNLLSGRDRLWPELVKVIMESPWIGWGGGATPTTMRLANVSSHNLFLQVMLQVGIVGLIPLLIAIMLIWKTLWRFRRSQEVRIAAGIFFIVLVCQSFEITLFQINLALSLPMWLALGLALGRAYSKQSNRFLPGGGSMDGHRMLIYPPQ